MQRGYCPGDVVWDPKEDLADSSVLWSLDVGPIEAQLEAAVSNHHCLEVTKTINRIQKNTIIRANYQDYHCPKWMAIYIKYTFGYPLPETPNRPNCLVLDLPTFLGPSFWVNAMWVWYLKKSGKPQKNHPVVYHCATGIKHILGLILVLRPINESFLVKPRPSTMLFSNHDLGFYLIPFLGAHRHKP